MNSAQAWSVIALGVSTAVVGVITAWKVTTVHKIVNSAATAAETEIRVLRSILAAKQIEISSAESARKDLAEAIVNQQRVADAVERTTIHAQTAQDAMITATLATSAPIPVVLTNPAGTPEPMPLQVSVQGEKK